jgi:hypothetical protein
MIDLTELEQFFPEINKPIKEGVYTFTISLNQNTEEDIFIINLDVEQEDKKESHFVQFNIGLGKDMKSDSEIHESHKPHFEIDLYRRQDQYSAKIYFTFDNPEDKEIIDYAKGTVVVITKIIEQFCKNYGLKKHFAEKLVYEKAIMKELPLYEKILVDALYICYTKKNLIVKSNNEKIIVKTPHNLKKYLDKPDLQPLYLPLLDKIKAAGATDKK